MQVKKFEAPTLKEAIEIIKKELGPEAVILQTRKIRQGFGMMAKSVVEVTAAVSDRSLSKKQWVEARLPNEKKKVIQQLPAERQASLINKYTDRILDRSRRVETDSESEDEDTGPASKIPKVIDQLEMSTKSRQTLPQNQVFKRPITATRYIEVADEGGTSKTSAPAAQRPSASPVLAKPIPSPSSGLQAEVESLKKVVEELRATKSSLGNQALDSAFEQLILNGVERRYAWPLVKKVAFDIEGQKSKGQQEIVDLIAEQLLETLIVQDPLQKLLDEKKSVPGSPLAVALVGTTGVGKTTTLAKLASLIVTKGQLKVGFINLDHYKVGAFDQLSTYSKILGLPFRSAASQEDLKAALSDFKALDLVLIDAGGNPPRNTELINEQTRLLAVVDHLHTFLVLSATTRDKELYDAINRFSVFKPEGLVISKLDEAVTFGCIYNMAQKSHLPLVYFATGQRVPDDLEDASRERVVSLILDI